MHLTPYLWNGENVNWRKVHSLQIWLSKRNTRSHTKSTIFNVISAFITPLLSPQEKELATSFPTYFWRASGLYICKVTLHNATLYTAYDKLPAQLQIVTNPGLENLRLQASSYWGCLDEGYSFQKSTPQLWKAAQICISWWLDTTVP